MLDTIQIKFSIAVAKGIYEWFYLWMLEKRLLLWSLLTCLLAQRRTRLTVAPRHQWPDDYSFLSVETSLRAILTYKNEGSEREVVSVLASRSMGSYGLSVCRCISLQTIVNDIVIVIGVMSEDRTCSNVGKKALQGLLRSDKFLCSELLMIDSIHRIIFVA